MMPECMLQNIAQPQRNPSGRPKASRRYTYTPPLFVKVDASSAVTSAPARVSTPAASQTSSTPATEGTRLVISAGWTNTEAPMIVPTTRAVAWGKAMARRSSGALTLPDRCGLLQNAEDALLGL